MTQDGQSANAPTGEKANQEKPRKLRGSALKPVPASIKIDLFGDLLKFTKKSSSAVSFRKFDQLAVSLAKKSRDERLLIYKIFCGLSLTAHARRTPDVAERKTLFDLKNKLFVSIANDPNSRRMINLRIGVSKRFKVIEYCNECREKNTQENLPAREWKFCQKCKIDRNFYNIISLYHRFEEGSGALFLGFDLMKQLYGYTMIRKVPLTQIAEELSFSKYKFSPKSLISIEIGSLKSCVQKLIEMSAKMSGPSPVERNEGPRTVKR